ncbi:MAG: tripartite tricarboxylate transporter TctB family protein [Planctomycetes bacterium]|nr:tripartite tricarboxylate transporter TctB family protein [Planctomycetota bacterium]
MQDIFTALGCLALGGYVVYEASGYPRQGDVEMHPGHYPGMLGYLMLALGAALLLKFLVKGGEKPPPSDSDRLRLTILAAALTGYSLVMEPVGYALSTFAFVALAVRLFRGTVRTSVCTGLIGAVVLNVVFRYIFKAPLPGGILF